MSDAINRILSRAAQARKDHRSADAIPDLLEAISLAQLAGMQLELARALTALGQIEHDLNQLDVARKHYEKALAIYRLLGDRLKLAHTVRHVADLHRQQGHVDQADSCYQQALAIYRGDRKTWPLDLANTIRGFALLKEKSGSAKQAMPLWQEAKELYAAVGVPDGVAESSRRLALLAAER